MSVATTRPETMLADTAVAVHPEDTRYMHLLNGAGVRHPLLTDIGPLPIVADTAVDQHLGTGAVKLTPGHSDVDLAICQRHNLGIRSLLDSSGRLVEELGAPWAGLPRFEARRRVLNALEQLGLLEGSQPHAYSLPICNRSGDVVEPVLRRQWFFRLSGPTGLGAAALSAIDAEGGPMALIPHGYAGVWREFLKKCRDWCVSRQLWWGHRIPAWRHRDRPEEWLVARSAEEAAAQLGSDCVAGELLQDEDVLDTWFSSALLPLSIQGWPASEPHLPLPCLVTGHDILFFWVARMTVASLALSDCAPFQQVLLHGLVFDSTGRKMSKSRGNVLDPIDLVHGCGGLAPRTAVSLDKPVLGADALRLALGNKSSHGGVVALDEDDVLDGRHFCNKLWQACRFIRSRADKDCGDFHIDFSPPIPPVHLLNAPEQSSVQFLDRWLMSRLAHLVILANGHYDRGCNMPAEEARQVFHHDFCDFYIEASKAQWPSAGRGRQRQLIGFLLCACDVSLRVLHPTAPHVTELLWQGLQHSKERGDSCLTLSGFPRSADWLSVRDERLERLVNELRTDLTVIKDWKHLLNFSTKNKTLVDPVPPSEFKRLVLSML